MSAPWPARLRSDRPWGHDHQAPTSNRRGPGACGLVAGLAAAAALLCTAPSASAPRLRPDAHGPTYGWPVKPFHRQHPVRGFFGDPRIGMTPKGMQRQVPLRHRRLVPQRHARLCHARRHRPPRVVPTRDGRGRRCDGHTEFQYWHIRPAVRNGQRVTAYHTVVGWVEPPWEHVHFAESATACTSTRCAAARSGRSPTRRAPRVKQLGEADGRPVIRHGGARRGRPVVEAYDETPIAVPGRLGRQAGHPRAPPLAADDAGRPRRPRLEPGDRPWPRTSPSTVATDRVRTVDAARTSGTASAATGSCCGRVGHPHGRGRPLRRRGLGHRRERQHRRRAVPDPRREPRSSRLRRRRAGC